MEFLMQKRKWVDIIIQAFKNLGGKSKYKNLYTEIERIAFIQGYSLTSQWKASVRKTIEDHSSDSDNFKSDDLFKKLGYGYWGMRETPNDTNTSKISNERAIPHTDLFIDGVTQERLASLKLRNQKLILNRKKIDNFTCQSCGFHYKDRIVEGHHLIPLSSVQIIYNSINDLVTLCPNCHALAHSIYHLDKKYQNRDVLLKKLKTLIEEINRQNY